MDIKDEYKTKYLALKKMFGSVNGDEFNIKTFEIMLLISIDQKLKQLVEKP